jgi:TetR/AcrR family transcriptional regulator of autoinduction and epiphytic fitness
MRTPKENNIVNAARAVFFKHGYKRVTMDDIAKASDISRPALYLVFKSKEDIFRNVLEALVETSLEEVSRGLNSIQTTGEKFRFAFEILLIKDFDSYHSSPEALELSECSFGFAKDVVEEALRKYEKVLLSILTYSSGITIKNGISNENTAHVLAAAARGFKIIAKDSNELRKLINDMLSLIGF